MLVQRIGKERIYAEAVDSHISGWFWNAAARARIRPIAQPQFDYELPTEENQAWRFTATVPVQPKVDVVDWTELEVGRPDAEVPQELVEQELEALRDSVAELVPAEGRPAREGDTLVVDIAVAERRDAARHGRRARRRPRSSTRSRRRSSARPPARRRASRTSWRTSRRRSVEVTVKEIKEKVLPEVDDELARSASEFDTLAELRADIEERLREAARRRDRERFRANAVDALVPRVEGQPGRRRSSSRGRASS